MRAVILLLLSVALIITSRHYVSVSLTQEGEYRALLYIINDDTSRVDISSNVSKSNFTSHSYLSSPGLSNTAVFISKGKFVDDDSEGNYTINYTMEQVSKAAVLDAKKANLYIDMVGRLGRPIEDSIKVLYQSKDISVFDMNRNHSVIMYKKNHQ